jgi:Na+/citrate or Na+/malate symporter
MQNEVSNESESSKSLSGALHPLLYKAMVGIALWLVVAAWGFLAGNGYILVMLSAVTWLVLFAVVLTSVLARFGRKRPSWAGSEGLAKRTSFRDWARGDVEISESRTKGSTAMIEIFVPLGAVAVGLTLFAIVRTVVVG